MATTTRHSILPTALADRCTLSPALPQEAVARDRFPIPARRVARVLRGAVFLSLAVVCTLVLLPLASGWYALWTAAPSAKIDPEAYARVAKGMGRKEIESAIGLPPGDYRDRAHEPGGRSYTEWSEEA